MTLRYSRFPSCEAHDKSEYPPLRCHVLNFSQLLRRRNSQFHGVEKSEIIQGSKRYTPANRRSWRIGNTVLYSTLTVQYSTVEYGRTVCRFRNSAPEKSDACDAVAHAFKHTFSLQAVLFRTKLSKEKMRCDDRVVGKRECYCGGGAAGWGTYGRWKIIG